MLQQKVDIEGPCLIQHPFGSIEGNSFARIDSSLLAFA
jgi:hypothetical protein